VLELKSKDLKIGGTWFKLPPRRPPNKCTTSKLKVKVLFKKMNYTTWVHTTSYKGLRYVKFVLNTKLTNVNYKLISTLMKYFESMFKVQSTCIMPKCVFHD
jgi:hypothetical protein